ncbi:MAG: DUF2493 domain-containing protein [Oscillospiraceae bacterium]|nr:DUF2493 domain-containing protein [Oscillospiraceae bacterium]
MKVAVVGSRSLTVKDLGKYLPENTTEIISGGAAGIDRCAWKYALSHGIKLTEFRPDYARYGRKAAPLKRNITIIESADIVLAFWNGSSNGTKFVIESCERMGVEIKVYLVDTKNKVDFIAYTKQPPII